MTVGNGLDKDIVLGPLQNSMQYEKVKSFYEDIGKENWKVAVGGSVPESKGYFLEPTIIDSPPDESRIVVEEPFGKFQAQPFIHRPRYADALPLFLGPIVPAMSWSNEDEVIGRANDTRMGLGASVWTNDLTKADRIARQLQVGSVWINTHFDLSPMAPFGGHKESGIGLEWGLNGLKALCNVQTIFYPVEGSKL